MTDMSNNDSDSEHDNSGNQSGNGNSGNQSGNGNNGNHGVNDNSGNHGVNDNSGNHGVNDNSHNQVVRDSSGNVILDPSCNIVLPTIIPITDVSSNIVIDGIGFEIVQETGKSETGVKIARTTFDTDEPEIYDPQISQHLEQTVDTYNDLVEPESETSLLLASIRTYAGELKCSDFHGKGSIDDYTSLFEAAARIATESKQMELDVDVSGFNEFAAAADELSNLFNGFIVKLQNVSIITDLNFLRSIKTALSKIVNLSNIFGRFKETVFATSAVQLPKSAHETKIVIAGVMDEINCAMQYVNHFVSPEDSPTLVDANLSAAEKNIIAKSVETIDNWNNLCEFGVSIAMSNDVDIQYIQQASNQLKNTTISLKSVSTKLKTKLAQYNIVCH
jgi:hypothetical protein